MLCIGVAVFFALPFVMVPNLSGLSGLQAIFFVLCHLNFLFDDGYGWW